MKLGVFFKKNKLGTLEKFENGYEFKSDKIALKNACKQGYLPLIYGFDKSETYLEFPEKLLEMFPTGKNEDLYSIANVNETDDEFDALCKISLLNLDVPDFYVKAEN